MTSNNFIHFEYHVVEIIKRKTHTTDRKLPNRIHGI